MSVGEILERELDRPAYVQFETRAVDDKEATIKAGHYVSKDVDYALITPPYSKDCVEKKVDVWFKQVQVNVQTKRVPQHHLDIWKRAYETWKAGQEPPENGTSVKNWNALSPAQCKNLISAGCRTIEDLAQANDEALRRIGMGANDLRNRAKAWLQAAKDHGPITEKITSLERENDTLKGSVESLQEQITLLTRQLDARNEPAAIADIGHPDEPAEAIAVSDILEKTPAEQYKDKFGKPPHHKMKESTMLERIAQG